MNEKQITINFSAKTIIWVIATIATLWLIVALKEVLIILLLSFIFASAIDPLIDTLEKKKIKRVFAILAVYAIVVVFLVLIVKSIIPPAISQFSDLAKHKDVYIEKITAYLIDISPTITENLRNSMVSFTDSFGIQTGVGFLNSAANLFNGVVGFIVVLVASFYLLLERDGAEKWISSSLPQQYKAKALTISKKITLKMSAWFRGQLVLGIVIFILVYLGLSILKVDYALTLAIIAGFLELLPVVGPIIAGSLAVLVALTTSPLLALIVAAYYALLQQLENHILVPQIMKKTLGIHPVAIIFALLAGGKLLGVLGIIIAVPVTAAITVIFNELYKAK